MALSAAGGAGRPRGIVGPAHPRPRRGRAAPAGPPDRGGQPRRRARDPRPLSLLSGVVERHDAGHDRADHRQARGREVPARPLAGRTVGLVRVVSVRPLRRAVPAPHLGIRDLQRAEPAVLAATGGGRRRRGDGNRGGAGGGRPPVSRAADAAGHIRLPGCGRGQAGRAGCDGVAWVHDRGAGAPARSGHARRGLARLVTSQLPRRQGRRRAQRPGRGRDRHARPARLAGRPPPVPDGRRSRHRPARPGPLPGAGFADGRRRARRAGAVPGPADQGQLRRDERSRRGAVDAVQAERPALRCDDGVRATARLRGRRRARCPAAAWHVWREL